MSRVSVGIPVYNGERYLKDTLDSLLAQTFKDFELIISDNASKDRTEEICREYCTKDKRIRYYRNEKNLGAAWNYNRVFELSTGEYFKWAAADDLCLPDYLKQCVDVLDREPEVILSYPKTNIIDESGAILQSYEDGLNFKSKSPSGRFLQFMYNVGLCNAVFGLIRSNVLKKTRLIGNYISSDKVLLAELSLLGMFREIPDYLFFRRFHPKATTAMRGKENKVILEFFNPQIKEDITLPHWRMLFEHIISIYRTNLRLKHKVFPLVFLFISTILRRHHYIKDLKKAIKQVSIKYRNNFFGE